MKSIERKRFYQEALSDVTNAKKYNFVTSNRGAKCKHPIVVFDTEYIENINNAMVMIFGSEYDLCGKELVIEDGRITQTYTGGSLVKELPPVGSEVWIDSEFVGNLKPSEEGKPMPVLEINGNIFSVFALFVEMGGRDIKFITPEGRLIS